MNTFERTAIFTMIETIESQIRGLKTLIAASAGVDTKTHKTTSTLGVDSQMLSDDEEEALARQIQADRERRVQDLTGMAHDVFTKQMSEIIGGDGGSPLVPSSQPMSTLNG